MARMVKTYSLSVDGVFSANQCDIRTDHGRRAKDLQITNYSNNLCYVRLNEDSDTQFTLPANSTQTINNVSVSIVEFSTPNGSPQVGLNVEMICMV